MATLKDLSAELQNLKKQMRFATAQALTATARKIQTAQQEAIKKVFDNPTPFTVGAVGSTAARRDNLLAKVFVRDIAASYLMPYEFGGAHKLNSKALLNPKNIKLNKYGNLPRNKLAELKAKPDVFFGSVDGIDGVWQRKKPRARKGGKGAKRRPRSRNGTRQPRKKQRPPKLLIRFGDALPVNKQLNYFVRAEQIAANVFPIELSTAITHAIATAH